MPVRYRFDWVTAKNCKRFLKLKGRNSPATLLYYRRPIKLFYKFVKDDYFEADTEIQAIHEAIIEFFNIQYKATVKTPTGRKPRIATRNSYDAWVRRMQNFLAWGKRMELFPYEVSIREIVPFRISEESAKAEASKRMVKRRSRLLEIPQITRLRNHLRTQNFRDYLIVTLMSFASLRAGATLRLRKRDVFKLGKEHYVLVWDKVEKRTGEPVPQFIDKWLFDEIQEYCAFEKIEDPNAYLFHSKWRGGKSRGKPMSLQAYNKNLGDAVSELFGKQFSSHDIRRSLITSLRKKYSPQEVAEFTRTTSDNIARYNVFGNEEVTKKILAEWSQIA